VVELYVENYANCSDHELALVDKIGQEIQDKKQALSDLQDQKRTVSNGILATEKSLSQLVKIYADELCNFTLQYMQEMFGIEDRHDANSSFLIFDESGQFVKVYRRGKDYQYNENLEKLLKKEKLYGHNASSWYSRSREFYNLQLREQLKLLSWTFDNDGKISDAKW
jgi:hypothetical protein